MGKTLRKCLFSRLSPLGSFRHMPPSHYCHAPQSKRVLAFLYLPKNSRIEAKGICICVLFLSSDIFTVGLHCIAIVSSPNNVIQKIKKIQTTLTPQHKSELTIKHPLIAFVRTTAHPYLGIPVVRSHKCSRYRVFSHDIKAILVSQNNETAAMLVSQSNPVGVELFSYAKAFFCSNIFA